MYGNLKNAIKEIHFPLINSSCVTLIIDELFLKPHEIYYHKISEKFLKQIIENLLLPFIDEINLISLHIMCYVNTGTKHINLD